MPGFFVDRRKVYRIEVDTPEDPETGEVMTRWVDLRKMTEGDIQDRNDIATQIRAEARQQQQQMRGYLKKGAKQRKRRGQVEAEEASMQYALGKLRGFDLVRSIVDWSLVDDEGRRVPPTPDNIKALDPFSATQIHNEIARINPSVFPGQADQAPSRQVEAEDYDLEYDEEYEAAGEYEDEEGNGLVRGQEEYQPQNSDDELYGPDEDAPSEAGGVAETGGDLDEDEEEVDPTRTTSANRP